MGFMQKLRQGMPAFIIIMIVAFIALIIFEWGDAKQGGGGGRRTTGQTVGEVNGKSIDYIEYQTLVDSAISRQRAMNPEGEVDNERIEEDVWNTLVSQRVIESAAEKMGITISNEQVDESLLYNPPEGLKQNFTDSTGRFMQTEYFELWRDPMAFLNKRQYPPAEIPKVISQLQMLKEEIRDQLLREAVESTVAASAVPSPAETRIAFENERMKASGSIAMLDIQSIPDDKVKVEDSEAKAYFDAHRNDFQQKAAREIRYVRFELAPSKQDSATASKRLTEVTTALQRAVTPTEKDSVFAGFVERYRSRAYDGTKYTSFQELPAEVQAALSGATPGAVIGPVTIGTGTVMLNVVDIKDDTGAAFIRSQHILLKTEGVTNVDSVKGVAESLAKRAKGGENFENLAREYSQDQQSAVQGGDLGYLGRGRTVPEFDKALFETPVGTITGPIKTQYGYHIIKINDKNSRSYKLRDLGFDPRISTPTKNNLRRRAQDFVKALQEGQTLDSAFAAKNGLQVIESGPVQRFQPTANSSKLTSFTYAGDVGDVSDPIELPDGSFVVGQISKIRKEGVMEFEEAKEQIVTRLRTQKKLDMLKSRAESLRTSLSAGDSLTKIAAQDVKVLPFTDVSRSSPMPGAGFDYPLTEAVFSAPTGQITGPIRGTRGYYIVLVTNRSKPTDQEFQAGKAEFLTRTQSQRQGMMFQQWLQKARDAAEIVDSRRR